MPSHLWGIPQGRFGGKILSQTSQAQAPGDKKPGKMRAQPRSLRGEVLAERQVRMMEPAGAENGSPRDGTARLRRKFNKPIESMYL